MTYTLEFKLAGLPKMTNKLRVHWRVKQKQATLWKNYVRAEVKLKGAPLKPLKTAIVRIVRHSSSRPDYDGLVSAGKHLIDGLVEAGVIENDKHENIGKPDYDWAKAPPGRGYVTVRVESIP